MKAGSATDSDLKAAHLAEITYSNSDLPSYVFLVMERENAAAYVLLLSEILVHHWKANAST